MGKIVEMLTHRATAIAVVDVYQVASTRDTTFDMPILARCHDEVSRVIIAANVSNVILNVGHSHRHILQAIKFEFNVQHDCRLAKCSATGTRPRVQERTDSEAMEQFIVHEPIDRYLINTHSFHNADLLREALPRSLVAPQPIFNDREAKHHELAALLRVSQSKRRDQLKAQREAKQAEAEAGSSSRNLKKRKATATA